MADYRDEFYAHYHNAVGSTQLPDRAYYDKSARQFRGRWMRWLPTDKSSVMLDLGCGYGEYLYFLRSMGYENLFGVDICEDELEVARQMVGINLVCTSSAEDYLNNKKDYYEVISAFNLFEHLQKEEIMRLLKLVHQALKPGGRLLAVTPNGLSPFSGTTRYWDFSHETSFTPASWRQLSRVTGFSSISFEEYGPISHSVLGAIRVVLWRVIRLALLGISYVEVGGPRDVSLVYTADMKIILKK